MSNRLQEILGGILGMFGNDQNPRVIDKSQYMTAGQEYLYGQKPGTPINMTGVTPNKGIMTDSQVKEFTNTIPTYANTGVTKNDMLNMGGGAISDYSNVKLPSNQSSVEMLSMGDSGSITPMSMSVPGVDRGDGVTSFGSNMPVTPRQSVDLSNAPITYKEESKTTEDTAQTKKSGFKDFADYLMSEEGMLAATMGFSAMTDNPNAKVMSDYASKRLETIRQSKTSNKTASELKKRADKLRAEGKIEEANKLDRFASDVQSGIVDGLTAWKVINDPKTPLVQIGDDKAAQKKEEFAIKSASSMIDAGNQAAGTIAGVDRLIEIGQSEEFNQIPNLARGFIPTGLNKAVDMYQSTLVGVAKGQRSKGEGPMSDKDIELLLENVGSIAMSSEARYVAQIGLRRNMERKVALQKVANDYMADKISRKEFYEKQAELSDRPIFSEEERDIIQGAIRNKQYPDYDDLDEAYKSNMTKEQYASLPLVEKYKFSPNWGVEK